MVHVVELEIAGRTLRLETGRVAKQADGSIWATYGDTVILATAVASQNAKPGIDFLPLTVDYMKKPMQLERSREGISSARGVRLKRKS